MILRLYKCCDIDYSRLHDIFQYISKLFFFPNSENMTFESTSRSRNRALFRAKVSFTQHKVANLPPEALCSLAQNDSISSQDQIDSLAEGNEHDHYPFLLWHELRECYSVKYREAIFKKFELTDLFALKLVGNSQLFPVWPHSLNTCYNKAEIMSLFSLDIGT